MAKFLETQAISNELMKLIKDAKDKIILISPYLKVNSQIQERLRTKSKLGTLSEIVIIYGKSQLQNSELEWIKHIDDLKVIEKLNLHAKCYLNEDRAIVCSMNLYDYSQQNNIEMGLLITKKEDEEAYLSLIDEINNIKVNGTRKKFDLSNNQAIQNNIEVTIESIPVTQEEIKVELSPEQKLKFKLLKEWRLYKSRTMRTSAFLILTDIEIRKIVTMDKIDSTSIYDVLGKKKAIQFVDEILSKLNSLNYYTIGMVVGVWYQNDSNSYDRVKFKDIQTGEEKWFDTTLELPNKDKLLAVKLNRTWFNEYLYLD